VSDKDENEGDFFGAKHTLTNLQFSPTSFSNQFSEELVQNIRIFLW